jgi:hypothetical protein
MSIKIKKFVVGIVFLSLIAAAFFAPLPRGIVLNYETKQCAGYWGGDEYVTYELPSGWKYFEFQYSEDSVSVNTDIGSCQAHQIQTTYAAQAKDCCSQLGYAFVSENIGIRTITSGNLTEQAFIDEYNNDNGNIKPIYIYSVIALLLIIFVILLVNLLANRNKEQ